MRAAILALALSAILIHAAIAADCGPKIIAAETLARNLECQGEGLQIDGGSLDCQGYTIQGIGLGIGIRMSGKNASIKRCVITGFQTGLLLNATQEALIDTIVLDSNIIGLFGHKDTKTNTQNTLTKSNAIGAYLDGSSIDPSKITSKENANDLMISPTQIGKKETPAKALQISQLKVPVETVRAQIKPATPEMLSYAKAKAWQAEAGLSQVAASKTITIRSESTQVQIRVRPAKDVKDLKVTEFIPKTIAKNSMAITSSIPRFEVVDEDLTILFRLGDVKAGTEKNITYTIDHKIAKDMAVGPFTIITILEEISPGMANMASILSVLFAGMLAYHQYMRHKARKPSMIGVYTALYITALACATLLGHIQTTLELPPTQTAYLLIAALIAAIGVTAWRIIALTSESKKPRKRSKKERRADEESPDN